MSATLQDLRAYCETLGQSARRAATILNVTGGEARNQAIRRIAARLRQERPALLAANREDVERGTDVGLSAALIDRLTLNERRIEEMAKALDEIAAFPDPIGRVLEGQVRPNGLEVQKIRVPLGVVLFLYESRPNVTTDAAALCLKSGNAVILRGGKEAIRTNLAVHQLIVDVLQDAGLPSAAVSFVTTTDRAVVSELLQLNQWIDVAIPRGGEDLIRRVAREARMPVIKHYKGVCHVYVHRDADLSMAARILENAKCQRPGVCNAAETLLVDQAIARDFLPLAWQSLRKRGVEVRGCPRTREILTDVSMASDDDFGQEFMDLILAVKVIEGIDQAIEHIARYGSGHTDAIVTRDLAAARQFTAAVDSSAVMVNASTRFNDGGQLGLGAEIGISTDKFHARGPCGIHELTSYKYVVIGNGQIRE